ncbi:hypothetical protein GCM10010381_62230 [Streptomyces xantholiticus]|nr:hypothetical protein GCM10010381_62230 [Streptomyces xantholiticus]
MAVLPATPPALLTTFVLRFAATEALAYPPRNARSKIRPRRVRLTSETYDSDVHNRPACHHRDRGHLPHSYRHLSRTPSQPPRIPQPGSTAAQTPVRRFRQG